MPLQETSGTASYDAFGGGAPVAANYIEDVFSTWLYTGNGSTQTITNGIDLSGKGGLVWIKRRTTSAAQHNLTDTARGAGVILQTDTTSAQITTSTSVNTFNANGFFLNSNASAVNLSGEGYVSWTFRKQPKFFDVVTYTGNGTSQTINHNLGSKPGFIIVKNASFAANWITYHQSLGATQGVVLNSTAAAATNSGYWNDTEPTTTQFTVGGSSLSNRSGDTFVAYLFAHNAGGFGLTGTDNVISCGSFTTDAGGAYSVSLGYEPQWVMIKRTDSTQNWLMFDNMRGLGVAGNSRSLFPNLSDAESGTNNFCAINATGFTGVVNASASYIYIAIRRGPMKTPTSGTSVFAPVAYLGTSATNALTGFGFTPDASFGKERNGANDPFVVDRLRGRAQGLYPNATSSEVTTTTTTNDLISFDMNGITAGAPQQLGINRSGINNVLWNFRRAPGFFDEVCYTGNGASTRSITHNLGVTPQLIITKDRSGTVNWYVLNTFESAVLKLNLTDANNTGLPAYTYGNGSAYVAPTSSAFTVDVGAAQSLSLNWSGDNYVSYLFASCPGVSKVGSYTGNGSTQTINCGFTGGARFVLIKRTDSTGDWYVYDTARGMTTLTDPYLLMNSTAAESATLGSVTTVTTGFAVNASILAAINTNGGSYIFLAIS